MIFMFIFVVLKYLYVYLLSEWFKVFYRYYIKLRDKG